MWKVYKRTMTDSDLKKTGRKASLWQVFLAFFAASANKSKHQLLMSGPNNVWYLKRFFLHSIIMSTHSFPVYHTYNYTQGSPNLQKIGRLDFSIREHEGEVKAWQGDFQQLHRDMFPQKCVVSSHHLKKKLHLKCAFANILLISFIFNFIFMFCICIIIIIDLICWF